MLYVLLLQACVEQEPDSSDSSPVEESPSLCPWGEARSENRIPVHGYLYEVSSGAGLEGVTVTPCAESSPVTQTDSAGKWVLSLPDLSWVAVDQRIEGLVPNRCVFDPTIEGTVERPFRIGMASFSLENFPMKDLDLFPVEGKTWIDIDALDLETGDDLPGTTIEISAPYEAAVGYTEETGFFFSNQTTVGYDVIFANVEPVPFDIVASHPDKTTCLVPPTMRGEGNDMLNISVYCY
ncbi:MAG TPA: hypothetical protein PKY30_00190 [Myxococcota bacterium]|nr:hypothetical protein [Myxococcota bacterium]HNH45422.1 hypothetical protein [Myxococcota bacterium]